LLALHGENGGDELPVWMMPPPKVADDGLIYRSMAVP